MAPRITRAADLILAEYGIATSEQENPVVTTIGVAAEAFARANPSRIALSIALLGGGGTIIIRPSGAATATAGLLLSQGQFFRLNWRDDFDLVTREWTAIGSGAGQLIYVLEQLLEK